MSSQHWVWCIAISIGMLQNLLLSFYLFSAYSMKDDQHGKNKSSHSRGKSLEKISYTFPQNPKKIPKNPKKSQKSFDLVHFFGSNLPLDPIPSSLDPKRWSSLCKGGKFIVLNWLFCLFYSVNSTVSLSKKKCERPGNNFFTHLQLTIQRLP